MKALVASTAGVLLRFHGLLLIIPSSTHNDVIGVTSSEQLSTGQAPFQSGPVNRVSSKLTVTFVVPAFLRAAAVRLASSSIDGYSGCWAEDFERR